MKQKYRLELIIPTLLISLFLQNCSSLGNIEIDNNNSDLVKETTNLSDSDEIITFFGNPGVGKSTLCNSIFGEAIFESGISVGKGLTTHKQEYIYEGKLYIDTPGLADIEMRKKAAEEIEKTLKLNNNYKIVFVATLENGRLKPSDLVTINTVCDAIKAEFEYGLIFNQVLPSVVRKIAESGVNQDVLNQYLEALHKRPSSAIILSKEDDLEGEDNMYLNSNNENRKRLLEFINNLKANIIKEDEVKKLKTDNYEDKIQEMEKMITRLGTAVEEQKKIIGVQQQELTSLKKKSDCVII